MHRSIVTLVALGFGVAACGQVALAQNRPIRVPVNTSADGAYVVSTNNGSTSVSDGNGRRVIYGDVTTGPGGVLVGTPLETAPVASDDGPNLRPTADDSDGDNLPNSAEATWGTDPSNPDSDDDGVADGDEVNIYGTDPTMFDTDGDGSGDGEELFWLNTDPLVPNGGDAVGGGSTDDAAQENGQTVASCGDYATWYEAQSAYEAAGGTSADQSLVQSLDPDADGIACESMME